MTKQASTETKQALNVIQSTFDRVQSDSKAVSDKMTALNSSNIANLGAETQKAIMDTHKTIRHIKGETSMGERALVKLSAVPLLGRTLPDTYRMMSNSAIQNMSTNEIVDACIGEIENNRTIAQDYCKGTRDMLEQNRKGIEELTKVAEVAAELDLDELSMEELTLIQQAQGNLEVMRTNEMDMRQILTIGEQVHTQVSQMILTVRNDLTTAMLKHETINRINELAQSMSVAQKAVNKLNGEMNKRLSTAMDSSLEVLTNMLEQTNVARENQRLSRDAAETNRLKLEEFHEKVRDHAKRSREETLEDVSDVIDGEVVDTSATAVEYKNDTTSMDDMINTLKQSKERQEQKVKN